MVSGSNIDKTLLIPSSNSYGVQSDVDETSNVVVNTMISCSKGDEVPQQQMILESQGGGELSGAIINAGVAVRVQTNVSGADAIAGLIGSSNV